MPDLFIVSTVGASLIRNYARYVGADPLDFLNSIDDMSREEIEDLKKNLIEYVVSKEYQRVSAELNSVMRILDSVDVSSYDRVKLWFLVSDTNQGRLVGDVLKWFFEKHIGKIGDRIIEVFIHVVEDLTYSSVEHVGRGLPNLIVDLSRIIKDPLDYGHRVILNITGGFKADGVYAAFVGLIAGVPVYYIHEKFQDIVELPPLPEVFKNREETRILLHMIEEFYKRLKSV